jgi:hypothetical protein
MLMEVEQHKLLQLESDPFVPPDHDTDVGRQLWERRLLLWLQQVADVSQLPQSPLSDPQIASDGVCLDQLTPKGWKIDSLGNKYRTLYRRHFSRMRQDGKEGVLSFGTKEMDRRLRWIASRDNLAREASSILCCDRHFCALQIGV